MKNDSKMFRMLLFALILIFGVADAITTIFFIKKYGIIAEGNPVALWIISRWGISAVLAYKAIIVAAVCLLLGKYYDKGHHLTIIATTIIIIVLAAAININNIFVIYNGYSFVDNISIAIILTVAIILVNYFPKLDKYKKTS